MNIPPPDLRGRDFIRLNSFRASELSALVDFAASLKGNGARPKCLRDKFVGLLFSVPSTRTRLGFQRGIHDLGGQSEYMPVDLLQKESVKDMANVLSTYLDALIVRYYDMSRYGMGRDMVENLAQHFSKPVINALDDKDHPCQVMGDLLTLRQLFGENYRKKRLVMAWGYAKRQKSPGVLHSMLSAAAILGMNVVFAYPKGFELDEEYLSFASKESATTGAKIEFSHDLMEASENADAIYMKSWKSLRMSDEEDRAARESVKGDWCLTQKHFKRANPGAYYMDCMPFIRGEQVLDEVADGSNSVIYQQAENNFYMKMAITAALLS